MTRTGLELLRNAALAAALLLVGAAARAEDAGPKLLAAAEPFETLTEESFSAKAGQLDRRIAAAETAAGQVHALLPADGQGALDRELAAIRTARQANDRAGIALAAVEGYRVLVSAAPPGKVPTEVSLLDYSGFRYDADLKAKPVRWPDMQEATHFASQQWDAIAGRVQDARLAKRVTAALQAMQAAVEKKSAAGARHAATSLLDLVDELEGYFKKA
jgi:hypothetical protein